MRFHSAMATLEPQKYVIAGTVGTENILLVSGRLVLQDCQSSKVSSIRVGYKTLNLLTRIFNRVTLTENIHQRRHRYFKKKHF